MAIFPTAIDTFSNPTSADKLDGNGGLNPALIHHSQHTLENDALSAIEIKLGVDFSSVNSTVDFALQVLEMVWMNHRKGGYEEVTPVGPFPTQAIWYTDSGKTIKIVEKNIVIKSIISALLTSLIIFLISCLYIQNIKDN